MPKSGPKTAKQPKANDASDPATDSPRSVDVRRSSTAPNAWYGGGTWRRGSKATPVTQVAKESILAATDRASEIVTSARNPIYRTSTPTGLLSSNLAHNIRSSSPSLSLASTKGTPVATDGSNNSEGAVPQPSSSDIAVTENGSLAVKRASLRNKSRSDLEPEQASGSTQSETIPDIQGDKASEETPLWRGWFPLYRGTINADPPKTLDAVTQAASGQVESEVTQPHLSEVATSSLGREAPPRTWLGLWSNAKAPQDAPTHAVASTATITDEGPVESSGGKEAETSGGERTSTAKSPGWAFWTREVSRDKPSETGSANRGELALAGSPSQSHPESAVLGEADKVPGTIVSSSRKATVPQNTKDSHELKVSPEAVDSLVQNKTFKRKSDQGQQIRNLLLPPMRDTYCPVERSSLMQSLSSWWQQKPSYSTNSARFIEDPPRIKRALVIGVHGYFPAPLIRSVLGQPTGTSIRFADGAATAVHEWTKLHGYSCEIEKVALEGEGKILERVDLLWKLLLNWIDNIRRADFVMIACHSQGVPVAVMLIAKLIEFGCVRDARIGVCAMAGVNLGPFVDYKSRWIGGSAGELFDFARPDSQVSKDYDTALTMALRSGVRVTFVGSIDDQLVSLHSSTFGTVEHSYIYRAVFIDGRVHAPDFLTHLVGFALKLRNLGISDHGLIRELSTPLAGSLYSGEGHSKIYEDDAVYFLAVQNALQTISVEPTALKKPREATSATQNPYILPFSLRGVLEEDYVKTRLQKETKKLLDQFDEWKPSTKILKDVKFRLEGHRSSMSFFSLIQKKGSKPIPPAPNTVRKEVVYGIPTAKTTTISNTTRPYTALTKARTDAPKVHGPRREPRRGGSLAKNTRRRKQLGQTRLVSDSESEESEAVTDVPRKRLKIANKTVTAVKRQLRCISAFTEDDRVASLVVHAADMASLKMASKYKLVFSQDLEHHVVELHYPSASQQELFVFDLVEPTQSDEYKPLDDIQETLEIILDCYIPLEDAATFKDDSHGLLRRMKRAQDKKDGPSYISLIAEWNNAMILWRQSGLIGHVLDELPSLDLRLIERILTQTYARVVSPRVSTLRQYENGTDNVYGELLPKFVSEIFRITDLDPNHLFVDLGSGVGNVVLQAALEVGCESWGCEIMENACVLAELQEQEFKARCRLWGFNIGNIHIQRGNFLENTTIHQVLQKADVILVNNQAFTPELNDRLTSHFLDLKEGCRIVSLKSFVPAGHKITTRNLNSAYNILDVVEERYYSGCVSWTDAPGSYFISRKDSSRLHAFADHAVGL
ncbi:MAG: hypothetical protein Q9218_001991 [Villophora microphyllina]